MIFGVFSTILWIAKVPVGWYIDVFAMFCTEVMDEVAQNVSPLDKIVLEIEELAESGGKYNESPHVIEVTLPMLCRLVDSYCRGVV